MMDIGIRIDASQVEGAAAAYAAAPEILIDELTLAVTEILLLLERETKELTPAGVTGGLRASIQAQEIVVAGSQVIGQVGTPLAYAVPVEEGTRPHMPPVAPLQDWAEHVLGVAPADSLAVAWAIARKIAARGTEGAHMFERAFNANRDQAEAILRDAYERAVARIEGRP